MIGYLGKINEKHLFYFHSKGEVIVSTRSGEFEDFCVFYQKCKASLILNLFEDFIYYDSQYEDVGKSVIIYQETKQRLFDFISWGVKNQEKNFNQIVEVSVKTTKFMQTMIDMVSGEDLKTKLILTKYHVLKVAADNPIEK